ncbi:MAG: glycine cleavage system aminomethyltransferase GcvT [Firmicutes bacterium]|nr:glycine cleavage system aminomethyltransferase GcvT [Bacillota bacterium]
MKKTALTEVHREAGAKMIDFFGWEMPVYYTSLIEEHNCVRNAVGIFDISHMGVFELTGEQALSVVSKVTTNDPSTMVPGDIQYSPLTTPEGTIIDDILIYRIENGFWLVVNCSNMEKDFKWIQSHLEGDAELKDLSDNMSILAIQGPKSQPLVEEVLGESLDDLKFYKFRKTKYHGLEIIVSRTGYTGEDGFEIYLANDKAVNIWHEFFEKGSKYGLQPAGLGARDTLRLEARLPLYGNDIDDTTTPLEAGLGRFVKLDKEYFIGKEVLQKQKEEGIKEKLVAFVMEERGIPRQGYPIVLNGEEVGRVTSGSMSPTLGKAIGMGYIKVEHAQPDTIISISIRGKESKARIIQGRFLNKN